MKNINRRKFLQTSSILLAAGIAGSAFNFKKKNPLLSFSTLGCPDWSFEQIVQFAAANQYNGIEVRGIQRELDLTKCNAFNTAQNRAATMRLMDDNRLKFVDLGSSSTLHFADPTERLKNLDEGRRFIDLAHELKCPFIRVFPNNFPKDQEKQATMALIIKGMLELADHAKGSEVSVLIESHGDLVQSVDLLQVMKAAENTHTGMIWDVTNMWAVTKESPKEVYEKLKRYIRHTHIKDAKMVDGQLKYTLLGQGDVPIFTAIDALVSGGYKGFYSFEWEKLWHPEIEEPEIALADYPKVMKLHFN